jgi:hypothetical protein
MLSNMEKERLEVTTRSLRRRCLPETSTPTEIQSLKFMPSPDSAMPGAYSFPGGYRAIPGKAKGSLRLYGPAGSLIGIAASLDEAQRIIRKKSKQ